MSNLPARNKKPPSGLMLGGGGRKTKAGGLSMERLVQRRHVV